MKRLLMIAWVCSLVGARSLWAGIPVNEHREVAPDALIEVHLVAGSVEVTGWDRSEMELTGSLGEEGQTLKISGGKNRLKIEVRLPEGKRREPEPSTLALRVPRAGRIEVRNISGPVTIADMTDRVEVNSVSGRLTVKGGSPRELSLTTVSGRISIDDGDSLENAEVNSVSGSIDAHLRFRPGGSFEFGTVSGPITLRLPDKVSAEFGVSTFSGSISSEFGDKPIKKSSFLPAQELEFTLGAGGALVEVKTYSGGIKIMKE